MKGKAKKTFVTRPAVNALLQTKRSVLDEITAREKNLIKTETEEDITRANTELLGAYPYIMPYVSYMCEYYKDALVPAPKEVTHFQFGTIENPIPFSHLIENVIIDQSELLKVFNKFNNFLDIHNSDLPTEKQMQLVEQQDTKDFLKREKDHFKSVLWHMLKENRRYWLQDKESGNYILDEPIRIVPVVDGSLVSANKYNNLVTKKADGHYKAGGKMPNMGFILYAYKPLFEGHFNNYQRSGYIQGGFICQPKFLYSITRFYNYFLPNTYFGDFTPAKIVQLFYYLVAYSNEKGTRRKIDMLKMLKYVLPKALEGNTIRHRNLKPIASSLLVIESITNDFPDYFDMSISGVEFNKDDWEFADRQEYPNGKNSLEKMLYAMKHHLKANNNKMLLNYISQKPSQKELFEDEE
ncbi:MAG: hypothetical protein FWC19_10335 [Treponema sp.]|nr:hypothetical protein [Treponema sp.]